MIKNNSKELKKEINPIVDLETMVSYKKVINMINDYNRKYGRSVNKN